MPVITRLALLLAAIVPATAPAAASTSVLGTSFARSCFEAAAQRRTGRNVLRLCDSALLADDLSAGDRVATLVNRGIVLMQSKDFDAAIADYDAAIAARPEAAEAYVNKGIALLRQGRDADAVATLTDAIARAPLRPEVAYYSRAVAHEGLGHTREAYEDYGSAARLAPQWAEPAEQLQRFQLVRRKTGSA